jgi:putative sterol carrier protein
MTAKKLIQQMPQIFKPENAQNTQCIIQFDITDGEPIYQKIDNGTLAVFEGKAENPDVTISMTDTNFVKLFKGELNPMTAFMMGKLKVKGDVALAQKLSSFVDTDKVNSLV